jgi:hypothetical protein
LGDKGLAVTKDELERIYLEKFAKSLPDFPSGTPEKSMNPDFLLHLSDHTLGIELTRLYRAAPSGTPSLKSQESLRERIAAAAKKQYDVRGLAPVRVTVTFNDQFPLKKTDVKRLSQQLVELAIRLRPESGLREEEFQWKNRAYFPRELIGIHVWAVGERSFWSAPTAAFGIRLSPSEVQQKIDHKNQKMHLYLKRCSRVWLVICTHAEGLSSILGISPEVIAASYASTFERVFIFEWPASVHQLSLTGAA